MFQSACTVNSLFLCGVSVFSLRTEREAGCCSRGRRALGSWQSEDQERLIPKVVNIGELWGFFSPGIGDLR